MAGRELPLPTRETEYLLNGARCLRPDEISFSQEICEINGDLNFYMEVFDGVDEVFGTHVCTDGNDDYVNIYADYDMEKGQVTDSLQVILCRGDGTEAKYEYPLVPAEKSTLLSKMEAYCLQETGISLGEYAHCFLSEQRMGSAELELSL